MKKHQDITIYHVLMMNYTIAQTLCVEQFKRRFGIHRQTFKEMVKALKPAWRPSAKPGAKPKLEL
jgi:hypothetical protein